MCCLVKHIMKASWRSTIFVALLLMVQPCGAVGVNINTTEGGAQQRQSIVYQAFQSFPDGGVNNITGNVEYRGGLYLGYNGQAYLGVTPPISKSITINSYCLIWLQNDLTLGEMTISPVPSPFNPYLYIYSDLATATSGWGVFFDGDITIASIMKFWLVGDSGGNPFFVEGNNHKLILIAGSEFIPSGVTLKNLTIMNAENISLHSSTVSLIGFQNVTLNSSLNDVNFSFGQGNSGITFSGQNNKLSGGGRFSFQNNGSQYLRIARNSKLYVAPQTTLVVGNPYSGGTSTYTFDDATSVLYLDNCTVFLGTPSGPGYAGTATFLKGTVYVNGTVTLQTIANGYLQLGDGISAANNCNVIMLPGSKLVLQNYTYPPYDPYGPASVTYGAILINKNV